MKKYFKELAVALLIDVVFGVVASVFCYFVIGYVIPEILTTSLMNGAIKFEFSGEQLRSIFSIWYNFCVLFGIRFVVAYITGAYRKREPSEK